jgi:signal transduction histidine kinase
VVAKLDKRLGPLRRRLGGLWFLGWSLCVLTLGLLAIGLERDRARLDFDTRLSITATATYGLAWFDERGQFHEELLLLDSDIADAPFDIWIVEPGVEPGVKTEIWWEPEVVRYPVGNLDELAQHVVGADMTLSHDAQLIGDSEFSLQTAQVFQDGAGDTPRAAVLVIGHAGGAGLFADPFVRSLGAYCLVLLFAGYALGLYLARANLRPVEQALETRERFLAAAAHELRTPLSALGSIADGSGPGAEDPALALGRVSEIAERTTRVVNNLLLFAQLDAGTRSLAPKLLRLDLLIESLAPEGIELNIDGGEVEVCVDASLFEVLVRNLFQNGVRYGMAREKGLHFTLSENTLTYRDKGPGFPPHVLEHADSELSFVSSHGGVGLGLTILRMVAALHGGEVRLQNPEGGGASIEIRGCSRLPMERR